MSVDVTGADLVAGDCAYTTKHVGDRLPAVDVDVRFLGLRDSLAAGAGVAPVLGTEPLRVRVPIQLTGNAAVVGPVTGGGRPASPCRDCLARRWQALRPNEERSVLERRGAEVRCVSSNPYLSGYALDAVSEVAAAAVADRGGQLKDGHGWVWALALDTLLVTRLPLVADPTCSTCAVPEPEVAVGGFGCLQSRVKPGVDTFRIRSVHEYGLDADAYANPVCGALGHGAYPAFESPTTSPVTGAMRMRGVFGFHEFFWSGHADRFDDSRGLAILEGLERYAGLRPHGPENQVVDSYANLRDVALDPRECGVYSDDYYSDVSFHRRFREDTVLRWVWARSLREDRPILVPEQIVYYGSGVLGGHETFVMECSNGCATGSCPEEAILYGMLELIERDAFLLCWYGRAALPEIDPRSCASADTRIMVDSMARMGYDVRLFDNRIDLPVPVVTAVAVRRDGGFGTLCFAAGSSLDPEGAVRAALCEVASYVPDFDKRTTADLGEARAMAADFRRVHELRHHALLYGLPEMAHHADFLLATDLRPRTMAETYAGWQSVRPRNLDLLDDVRYLRDLLTGRGFDVIVADQTCREQRAERLSTTCVIVPGLLPIDFGWDRQRALHMSRTRTAFRDAPRWGRELDATELNTAPHPFP